MANLQEWRERVSKQGTSGDQVYDILADWESNLKELKELHNYDACARSILELKIALSEI